MRPRFATAILAAATLGTACRGPYPPPPGTARDPVVDTIHGVEFTDDYRWLEDQYGPATRAWIAEQNAYAELVVGDTALRAELAGRLRELMDVPGALFPRRAGDYEYFSMRRPGREAGAIHRRPAPTEREYAPIDPEGDFEVVVDPLDIHPDGTTGVSIRDFSPDGDLMLYAVRDGGRDEVSIRVRNLDTGEDLPDRLPGSLYGRVSFNEDGSGFHYVSRSRETGGRVRLHMLGTDVADDVELFGQGQGPESFVGFSEGAGGRHMVYTVHHGWARTDVYLQDLRAGGEPRPIVGGAPARFSVRFVRGELWLLTNLDAPRNRIVAVDPRNPGSDPADWRVVLPEAEDVLTGYQIVGDRIYADYLHNVSSRIVRYGMDGTRIDEIPVPRHHVAGLRPWRDGTALLTLTSLTTPPHILEIDLETLETTEWLPSAVPFDGDAYEVGRHWYTSPDGTRGPLYVVHRKGLEPGGDTPTLLYGYGGFNVNLLPRFDARAAVWMERGGVYAIATLRGGGEFGETWHRAGMLENKPNVFDDFIAAAEWLIESGYTSPERLAIRGVSNGGLLVAGAMITRPDLFRAVFCGFPDLDMVRFNRFTDTNNMPALLEYGNAAVPEEFEVLQAISPYQNVLDGVDYPAVMLTQGDLDTRVPPLQARKMAARLQAATASGLPVILDYDPRAGHAGGRTFSRRVRNAAMELAFLLGQVGGEEGGP
ncbi:MAG: prolyl oligopeptidase family serine peptidase [Gemmatimonadota bacterium]|nr:prolyl oligopeptidase family serine peptidase [Gemmatimonadota bacterium]MDE2870548.1 prolyl oligopeptidase family serine peptidase [Gemmatimonadota bacterium]